MHEFKLFGHRIKIVRAATPIVISFFFAVILQTAFNDTIWITILVWLPFALTIYLGFFYQKVNPIKYAELEDWQQEWQYLHKPFYIGQDDETYPKGEYFNSEMKRLRNIHTKYFEAYSVDIIKGIAPTLITILGAIIFVIQMEWI